MKTVYILGAGFSKPAGAPLGSELLDAMQDLAASSAVQLRRRQFVASVLRRIEPWFGDLSEWTFEEIFTITHSRTLFESLTGKVFAEQERLRLDLMWAVIFALNAKIGRNARRSLYDRFVDNLGETDAIISLNYDVILEEALVRRQGGLNYGIPLRNILNPPGEFLSDAGCVLLKIHGSSNLLRCNGCRKWLVALGKVAERVLLPSRDAGRRSLRCIDCASSLPGRLTPVLVPPSFDKVSSLQDVSPLWKRAVAELGQADRVVFIGCSLNSADFDLEALFRTTLGKRVGVPIDLVCLDSRLLTRFAAVFPRHRLSVDPSGFEAWLTAKETAVPEK